MQASLLTNLEESSFESFMVLLASALKKQLGETVFFAWFKDVAFSSYDGKKLIFSVKNDKVKNCIFLHYQTKFERAVKKTFAAHFNEKLSSIEITVSGEAGGSPYISALSKQSAQASPSQTATTQEASSQFNIGISLEKKYTFGAFIEAEENRLAVGMARHFSSIISDREESLLPVSRQFFVYGSIGNGKTHLAQAIAAEVMLNNRSKRVLYTTAERFLFNYITAVRSNALVDFQSAFLGVDLLVIDDLHFVCTKKSTIEEITRMAYSVITGGGYVLFSATNSPGSLPIASEYAKNFIGSSHAIKIEDPSEELRFKILQSKVQKFGYKVSDSVLKLLAAKIKSNVRELEGAMGRMVLHSQILNYEIDSEASKMVLTDIFPHAKLKRFSISEVQLKTCTYYDISLEDVKSAKRNKFIVRARQVGIFLSSQLTNCSYVEIGRNFGNRTHSTVIHSISAIKRLSAESRTFKDEVDMLRIKIEDHQ